MSSQEQLEAGEFRKALGSFTTGVTVVTTRGTQENDIGLTANSFNSVSMEPPMVLWSLGKNALSMPHFKEADYFAVHILSQDQEELSLRFAQRGVDKFAGLDLDRGPEDIPLIKNCAACFVCKTAYQYEGGDHIIFVGEVLEFTHWDRAPLLFHGGQYGQIVKSKTDKSGDEDETTEATLGYLLSLAMNRLLKPLTENLTDHNLTLPQYFTLALLAKYNARPKEQIFEMLDYGGHTLQENEFSELEVRGLIEPKGNEYHLTSEGAMLHVELVAFYKDSESAALEELDYDGRQTLKLSLIKIIESASHKI